MALGASGKAILDVSALKADNLTTKEILVEIKNDIADVRRDSYKEHRDTRKLLFDYLKKVK